MLLAVAVAGLMSGVAAGLLAGRGYRLRDYARGYSDGHDAGYLAGWDDNDRCVSRLAAALRRKGVSRAWMDTEEDSEC